MEEQINNNTNTRIKDTLKRIRILETQKEDTEIENREIDLTIQKMNDIKDTLKSGTTAKDEVKRFLEILGKQKQAIEGILGEITESIDFVKDREITSEINLKQYIG
jgi:hypothetical protein